MLGTHYEFSNFVVIITITVVSYSAPSRLPTQERSQARSNRTVLRVVMKDQQVFDEMG